MVRFLAVLLFLQVWARINFGKQRGASADRAARGRSRRRELAGLGGSSDLAFVAVLVDMHSKLRSGFGWHSVLPLPFQAIFPLWLSVQPQQRRRAEAGGKSWGNSQRFFVEPGVVQSR